MDTFGARSALRVGDRTFTIWRLDALERRGFAVGRLPWSLRILLENVLRNEDGVSFTADDVEALARWSPAPAPPREIAFMPARVLLQDFTGVPALVDLAAMRDAIAELGGDGRRIDPLLPVELVIDHSVQVDAWASPAAFHLNEELEYRRNHERYTFLKWGQGAFPNLRVVPPGTGICHQVNLEHLARVVVDTGDGRAFPDTLVGTDSHTPMVNGLGVLGWGVGGIEAEAAMLGQPLSMLVPVVVGVRLTGELREGTTATDLVLTVCERLRKHGVVGKFVEFFGEGVARLSLADRATIGNMTPEYGATCAIFPFDQTSLDYLRFTGRPPERLALVEAYLKEQGLWHGPGSPEPLFSEILNLDLGEVEPSIAGPGRPQDRVPLSRVANTFREKLPGLAPATRPAPDGGPIGDGAVVIAAITSCTNTSNPSVMLGAGLLAKKAVERGLRPPAWVKTSLAPGSQVVAAYLAKAGLQPYLDELGFHVVGYGCTTCIGNSGPLPPEVSKAVADGGLVACAVLSGNRNFEGRIHGEVRANWLMSPPLVVAYALAGRIDVDLATEPLGHDPSGKPVYLRDVWPSDAEVADLRDTVSSEMFARTYARVFEGDARWDALAAPTKDRYAWDPASTYVRRPTFLEGLAATPGEPPPAIRGARVLAWLGDSVTTDHVSPAGNIRADSPAGRWLREQGVEPADFNSYGARRGNHEVMVRGTFASPRIRNRLVPGVEGGYTRHLPTGEVLDIWSAADRYRGEGTPLVVIAGREYGSGSSRDWAAKGPKLLGVVAVLAESFERIHRSNLVGMGILPLQLEKPAAELGLTGAEGLDLEGWDVALTGGEWIEVVARRADGNLLRFRARVRLDTPQERLYLRHGGILPYVLRNLLHGRQPSEAAGAVHATAQAPPGAAPDGAAVEEGSEESFPASDPPVY
ncbi:MAG: aconitate hydratase AcnA [Myxococcota bacterium]